MANDTATTTTTTTTVAAMLKNASTSPAITTMMASSTSTLAKITTTILNNQTTNYEDCLRKYSVSTCRLAEFIRVLAYLLLAVSLIPQIIHLFHHRSRYIAGISYLWLVTRVLALASLMVAHGFAWTSTFELIALVSTVVIFVQVFFYSDNLHRQQKLVLIGSSLLAWAVGGALILLLRKRETFLLTIGYLLLAVHMLPQILLNSLLRTAKSISKFSVLFLAMSDTLLFASFYTVNESFTYLVTSYYTFSFFLFVYVQSLVYADAHVHLISRSAHTVLTPGVDIYTGLDTNGSRSSGQDPQMFSIDDLEPADGTDVVYQPVTFDKASQPAVQQTPMKQFVWYATLAAIFSIETVLTIMLIYRAWSPWIIFVPLSIPAVLSIFFFLRTRLNVLQMESLRRIL